MRVPQTYRARLALVAVAAAGVAVVLVAANVAGNDRGNSAAGRSQTVPASSAPVPWLPTSPPTATAGPGDDGAPDGGDRAATITDGPAEPAEAATQFMARFLNTLGKTPEQWRDSFADLVTPALAGLLADTDPARVPAGRVGSRVTVATAGDELVVATVPIVANSDPNREIDKVRVTMTGASHRWLVSELDVAAT
jgi:hypothetical protein